MAEKDKIQRTLESYNDVFADIVNVLLFGGKETVHENNLTDAQPFLYYKMEGKKIHSQERDVSKFWNNGQIRLSLIGFENQMKVEKDMPLRVISYDGAAYRSQLIKKKKESYYPVITLILYFGTKEHWKNNRSLKEVLPVPTELDPFVSDYKINVFELAWLTDKQISMFKSDFRDVAQFLKCQRTGEDFPVNEKKLQHTIEILDLLRVMSNNDSNLVSTIEDLREESIEGGIGMGNVVQRWIDKRCQQKAEEAAINLLKMKKLSPEEIAQVQGLSLKQVLELQKKVLVKA